MELIKTNNSIESIVPKIIETPKHFSLNTQLYDKLTLKPYPMKFFTQSTGKLVSLYTSIDRSVYHIESYFSTDTLYNTEDNQINIIQDKKNPDIFYSIKPYNSSGHEGHLIEKIHYDSLTMEYNILNSINLTAIQYNTHKNSIKTIYENDEYFVFFSAARHQGGGGYNGSLIVLHKQSFGFTPVISTTAEYNDFFLIGSGDNIYILRFGTSIFINKLNLSTKQTTQLFEYQQTDTTVAKRVMCNPVKVNNDYYMLFTHFENNGYTYKIMKTSIDTDTDTVTSELLDLDLNGHILDDTGKFESVNLLQHTLRVIEDNGNAYLSLLVHTMSNSTTTTVFKQCKHVLIEMKDDSFKIIDSMLLKDGCFGSLVYNDSKHQIFFTSNNILFTVFDSTERKMKITYRKSGIFAQVGLDSLNRVVTHSKDNTIEIITEGNATTLQADFDKDIYDKDRFNNIESHISFYAKNFLDEYVDTNVKLTLIGPVKFKENESQELITSSSDTGIKSVPVVITGYGNIEVVITQNT